MPDQLTRPVPPALDDRRAWRIGFGACALGLGAAGMSVQYVVGALSPVLVVDLELSRTQLGIVPSMLFGSAALVSFHVGRVVAWLGGRRATLANLVLSIIAVAIVATANGFTTLLVAAGIGGLAAAASNPVTNTLVASHVNRRPGLYLGLKQAGAQLYAFLCGAVLPLTAMVAGWRTAALVATAPSVLGLGLVRRIIPAGTDRSEGRRRSGIRAAGLLPLWVYALVMGAGQGPVIAYLPLYGFEALELNPVQAGAIVGVTGIAGVIGRICWGYFAFRFRSLRALLVWLAASSAAFIVLVTLATSLGAWAFWVGALGFGATSGWMTAVMITIVQLGDPGSTANQSSRIMLPAYLGVVISGVGFGALVDATGSYQLAWSVIASLFAFGVLAVLPASRLRERPR